MSDDRTITIDDVAKLAGVSRATAGRVVGNYGSVSEKSRERVWDAVRQLDLSAKSYSKGVEISDYKNDSSYSRKYQKHIFHSIGICS